MNSGVLRDIIEGWMVVDASNKPQSYLLPTREIADDWCAWGNKYRSGHAPHRVALFREVEDKP
jgi:hypothetical protein